MLLDLAHILNKSIDLSESVIRFAALHELTVHFFSNIRMSGLAHQQVLVVRYGVLEQPVRQNDIGAGNLVETADGVEDGSTAVDDDLECKIISMEADGALARRRVRGEDGSLVEGIEKASELEAYLCEDFLPFVVAARIFCVEKQRITFDFLETQRNIYFAKQGFDQERDVLLTVYRRHLILDHEFRIATDVCEDNNKAFFSCFHLFSLKLFVARVACGVCWRRSDLPHR